MALGPLRPTAGAEHVSAGIIVSLAFSSISQLLSAMPMERQQEAGFACPHPHSACAPASTVQLQTSSAEILPQTCLGLLRH